MTAPTSKAERSDATRRALIAVARGLFAERGYAQTPIEEIVRRAQVTRGALYHHFQDKRDLFRAVYEDVEKGFAQRLGETVMAEPDPALHLQVGCDAFLDACLEPDMQRIALLDAPSVLGWESWKEVESRYGLALVVAALTGAIEAGVVARQPVEPLARLLLGALNEAGLSIARADDVEAARAEMGDTLGLLLEALKPRA